MKSSLTSRLLVVCSEAPEPRQAGERDQCWLLAEALAVSHDVILALPAITGLSHQEFAVVYYNERNIGMVARDSDVVVCDAGVLALHPQLVDAGKPVAVDLTGMDVAALANRDVLVSADFFFCPNEDDRRVWLEALGGAGRVNEHTLEGDSGFRNLIDVVRPGDLIQPLMDYSAVPRFARDRGTRFSRAALPKVKKPAGAPARYWRRFRYLMRTGGILAVWTRGGVAIKRKIRRREQK